MEFFQTVKQIGAFMICAQVLLHFKPSPKYEKYLKLLISVMVLVQILVPFINLFSGKNAMDFDARVATIQKEINQNMEWLELENAISEENILKYTLEEVKTRINNIVAKEGVQVSSVEYGSEKEQDVLVFYIEEYRNNEDINIHIDTVDIMEKQVEGGGAVADDMPENNKLQVLRKTISSELNVSEEKIEVLWYE